MNIGQRGQRFEVNQMPAADNHTSPCGKAIELEGRVANNESKLGHLETAVYGNGRKPLRQDIDENRSRIVAIEKQHERSRATLWAVAVLLIGQAVSIALALLK